MHEGWADHLNPSTAFTSVEPQPAGYEVTAQDIFGYMTLAIDPAGIQPPLRFNYGAPYRGWHPLTAGEQEELQRILKTQKG